MSLMDQAPAAAPAAQTPPPAAAGVPPAAQTPPPGAATPPAAQTPPGTPPAADETDFKVARPDYVPEKFWDAEKSTVRNEDVFKSYGELEKALTKAKEPPKAPDKYEYTVSEDLKKDFNIEGLDDNDPYLVGFRGFAKENGLTQEQHDKFVNFYMRMDLESARQNQIAEFAKLGNEAQATQRIKTLAQFGAQHLSEGERAALSSMLIRAEHVGVIEKLVNMATTQRQMANVDGQVEGGLTEEKLNAMMRDDRYHDRNHPEFTSFRKKVDDGFKRLYPEK